MINPQYKFRKLDKYITLFDITTCPTEEAKLLDQLKPIKSLVNTHPKNSIYIYKSGGLFYAEALLHIEEKYASTNSVGCTLDEVTDKLVPKVLKAASSDSLFPRNKQIEMGGTCEFITK